MRTFSLLAAAAIIAAMASIGHKCDCLICEAVDSSYIENGSHVWRDSLAHLLLEELAHRDVHEFVEDISSNKKLVEMFKQDYDGLSANYVDSLGHKIEEFESLIRK